MSSGAKQITKIGFETTPGVLATSWQTLGITSNTIDAQADTTESQTIKDSRIAAGTLVTGVTIQGDIETEFAYGVQDGLLECAAFNPFVNNVLTFGGAIRKTISAIRGFKDVNNYHAFTGLHVNQWALSIADSGIVTSKFSLMGMGRTPSVNDPASNATAAPNTTPFTSLATGTILINGVAQDGMCITQLDLTVDNGMQVQKCLGKTENNGIGAILETIMKVSGSFTVAWSQKTAEFYEKQFKNEAISIEFPLVDGSGNKYVIKLPKILISAPLASGAMADILTSQFSYTVADEAPTITRTPVVIEGGK